MTDKYFAMAIENAIKTAMESASYDCPAEFGVLDITHRSNDFPHRPNHPVYDVLVSHAPIGAEEYTLSAYEVHILGDGEFQAMFNGYGYYYMADCGSVRLSNACISWAWFTREIANDWLREVQTRLNNMGCA